MVGLDVLDLGEDGLLLLVDVLGLQSLVLLQGVDVLLENLIVVDALLDLADSELLLGLQIRVVLVALTLAHQVQLLQDLLVVSVLLDLVLDFNFEFLVELVELQTQLVQSGLALLKSLVS
jgi:hypothetical protein